MGIWGLMTFMKLNDCCEQVRLSDIADAYRNKTGKDPVLLVDYSSVLPFFYTSSPGMRTVSGELKKIMENLKTFVSNCKELGIELKFFGDGKKPPYKYRVWVQRTATKILNLGSVYSGHINSFSEAPWRGVLFWVANYFLKKNNCKFSRGIYEADSEIFKHLKTEDCFAVLSNDTDFIMADNVHYCLTPHNLNLQSMTFLNLNRSKLAELLKINASQFPLFASLSLSHFHFSDLFNQENTDVKERFFEVAKLIKNLHSKEELVQYILSLKEPKGVTDLERRLNFYFGQEEEEEKDVRHTAQNHWDKIVELAEERHVKGETSPEILSIIQDRVKFCGPTCENVFNSLAECAILTIRKKIYGILFFEHPNSLIFVTEFWFDRLREGFINKRHLRTVIVERRSHPGLLKLWSQENSNSLKTLRLTVFCEVINDKLTAKDFSSLNIPVEYVFPILAAFYLLWECDKKFTDFEAKTILIQAVLVNRLTEEQFDQLPEQLHMGALNLTGWLFAICNCLSLLNSVCGEAFCRHKTNILNFFDGKVIHYVYGKMKEGESPWTSFSQYEKEYETLISALYKLGRLCDHVEPKEKRGSLLN